MLRRFLNIFKENSLDIVSRKTLDIIVFINLTLLVSFAGFLIYQKGVCGLYHDDGIYVITAKSLAEGKGYRLIQLPGAPRQTKYPILYPAILAVIWKLWPNFPDNMLAMKFFNLLCSSFFIGLTYLYLVRFNYCTRPVALAISILLGTTPTFLFLSVNLFSEPIFSLLSVGVLWIFEQQARAPLQGRFKQFLLGMLLVLPFWCRTIGIAIILAGLAFLYRLKRPCFWIFLGAVLVIFPWGVWISIGMFGANNYTASSFNNNYQADYL